MKPETKNCQNCKKDFTIEPEDFKFYEKIKVPPPTWCPECRQQRRYAWRNERTLYRRNCDLCGKSTVTIYSPNKNLKVYCLNCWWGDGWDPSIYAQNFDFSKSFFEQYHELQKAVPRMALLSKNAINSDYTNHSADNKNTYLSFCCFETEDVFYSTWVMKSKNVLDSSYIYDGGEKIYDCINSRKIYHCQSSLLLENCIDCFYCFDLRGCANCFMSSNLRNKNYVFQNKQCSKEKYFEKVKECKLDSYDSRQNLKVEFSKLLSQSIHKFAITERNINCTGNLLYNCKNAMNSFDSEELEDTKNIYASLKLKSSMDLYHTGWGTDFSYECHGCRGCYSSKFCHLCYDNRDLFYCDSCQNCQNLFGCISIKKGEYMILNKKYQKDEYLELKEKIIEHMKKTGEYGEFFPPQIAPVCYNETQGAYYMPEEKETILSRGWLWEENVPGTYGKETISQKDIPDSINDIKNDIISEILKCIDCGKNYNISTNEFAFYKSENVPTPRICPVCRYKNRFKMQLPRKLWDRSCMCEKDNHGHDGKCDIKFETPYSPERKEKVYCKKCYQQEVY